jgi:RNA polymerase sigma-70 factor (ECF subfamily)
MAGVAANDAESIAALYDRFGSLVFRLAAQSLPSRTEAEDAVQEVFVRIWRTADRYDSSRAALVTWVMLITRRHIVDRLRRKRARITAISGDTDAGWQGESAAPPESAMRRDEEFQKLLGRIETLPDLQRTVVLRAYLGGQTLRQIGEELGAPIGTIKSALSRALVRLRERVNEEES